MSNRRLTVSLVASAIALAALPGTLHAQPIDAPIHRVLDQLTPADSVVLLVDFQPQYAFSTHSSSIDAIVTSAQGLAKAAKAFGVPVIKTTISAQAYAGPMLADIAGVEPGVVPLDRTVINAWSDPRVRDAVHATNRRKLIIAGLWTDNCVMLPALAALKEGYEVYVVTDASGDYDVESHERAVQRLVQAGAVPITWLPVMLEWQADWSREDTAPAVQQILRENAKAIAAGAQYAAARKP